MLAAVPYKGQVLNQTSAWWMKHTQDIIPNAMLAVPDPNVVVMEKCEVGKNNVKKKKKKNPILTHQHPDLLPPPSHSLPPAGLAGRDRGSGLHDGIDVNVALDALSSRGAELLWEYHSGGFGEKRQIADEYHHADDQSCRR